MTHYNTPLLNVVRSGSKGNFCIYDNMIAIDCGISYSEYKKYSDRISAIIITHTHGDHLNISTIKTIAQLHKNTFIYAMSEVAEVLMEHGVYVNVIDYTSLLMFKTPKGLNIEINFVYLYHDVQNFGLLIKRSNEILDTVEYQFYGTDTHTLDGINIPKCNEIYLECNYNDDVLHQNRVLIKDSQSFDYTRRVEFTHLSYYQWQEFGLRFLENENSLIYALHQSNKNNNLKKIIYTRKEINE